MLMLWAMQGRVRPFAAAEQWFAGMGSSNHFCSQLEAAIPHLSSFNLHFVCVCVLKDTVPQGQQGPYLRS